MGSLASLAEIEVNPNQVANPTQEKCAENNPASTHIAHAEVIGNNPVFSVGVETALNLDTVLGVKLAQPPCTGVAETEKHSLSAGGIGFDARENEVEDLQNLLKHLQAENARIKHQLMQLQEEHEFTVKTHKELQNKYDLLEQKHAELQEKGMEGSKMPREAPDVLPAPQMPQDWLTQMCTELRSAVRDHVTEEFRRAASMRPDSIEPSSNPQKRPSVKRSATYEVSSGSSSCSSEMSVRQGSTSDMSPRSVNDLLLSTRSASQANDPQFTTRGTVSARSTQYSANVGDTTARSLNNPCPTARSASQSTESWYIERGEPSELRPTARGEPSQKSTPYTDVPKLSKTVLHHANIGDMSARSVSNPCQTTRSASQACEAQLTERGEPGEPRLAAGGEPSASNTQYTDALELSKTGLHHVNVGDMSARSVNNSCSNTSSASHGSECQLTAKGEPSEPQLTAKGEPSARSTPYTDVPELSETVLQYATIGDMNATSVNNPCSTTRSASQGSESQFTERGEPCKPRLAAEGEPSARSTQYTDAPELSKTGRIT